MYADNNMNRTRELFDLARSLYSLQTLSVIGDTYLISPVITSLPGVRGRAGAGGWWRWGGGVLPKENGYFYYTPLLWPPIPVPDLFLLDTPGP